MEECGSHLLSVLPVSDPGAFPEAKSLWQTFWKDFTHKSEMREGFQNSFLTLLLQPLYPKYLYFHSERNTTPDRRWPILDYWASHCAGTHRVRCEYGSEQWPLNTFEQLNSASLNYCQHTELLYPVDHAEAVVMKAHHILEKTLWWNLSSDNVIAVAQQFSVIIFYYVAVPCSWLSTQVLLLRLSLSDSFIMFKL